MTTLVGTEPNQIPTNADLGDLAYQNAAAIAGPVGVGGGLSVSGDATVEGSLSYSGTLTGSSEAINIGSGQVVKDASGNVGIGITPTQKLHVNGTVLSAGSFLGPDGSVSVPTFSFSNDANTGMYRSGVDVLAFTAGGTQYLSIDGVQGALTITAPLRLPNGSAGTPTLLNSGSLTTGIYFPTSSSIGFSTGGTQRVLVDANGLTTPVINAGNLVGQVAFFAMSTAPTGWLKANGAEVSRTTYAALFAAIGETFGVGDGSTTFNLPDLRDRMPIGAENLYALAATGGSKDAVVVDHTHTLTDPGHRHQLRGDPDTAPDGGVGVATDDGITTLIRADSMDFATTGITVNNAGVSGTDANLPPYLGLVACIKY